MTALEMKYKFDIKMRELLGALNHPFNTNEINRLLNEAQLKIVREYSDFFDRNEDVRKILSVLVKPFTTTTINVSTTYPNAFYVDLPDLLNIVSERVNNSNNIKIKPFSHDEYIININCPFKKPDSNNVWRIDMQNHQELITDGSTSITSYQCSYIDMPPDIDIDNGIDCVLQSQIHEDIINSAIQIALSIIQRSLNINKINNK